MNNMEQVKQNTKSARFYFSAKEQIKLLASANTSTEHSENTSSSSSAGVGLSGKKLLNVNASASGSNGDGNGGGASYNNTHIKGKAVKLQSGTDTTLAGAVVQGDTVQAKVGGKLTIQSLQDTDTYSEQSQSWSASGNVGFTAGGATVAGSKTNIDSAYRSVAEQSAIRAGDGGFQVDVAGSTTLEGGAITSTDKAVNDKANSFSTASLTIKDLNNSANYSADSASVSVGVGNQAGGSAGVGHDEGSAQSTTRSGISGIAGNKTARTGDKETGIAQIFDKDEVKKDTNAQVEITKEFGRLAPKAVADYAQTRQKALQEQANNETDPDKKQALQNEAGRWAEGGAYRVAMHTVLGGLAGGVNGAAGAGTIAAGAPLMDKFQDGLAQTLEKAGFSKDAANATAKAVATATALGVGTAVGGAQGGAMAMDVDANNRQLHRVERDKIEKLAKSKAESFCSGRTDCDPQKASVYWSDLLQRVASGIVDDKAYEDNMAYLSQMASAGATPGTEA